MVVFATRRKCVRIDDAGDQPCLAVRVPLGALPVDVVTVRIVANVLVAGQMQDTVAAQRLPELDAADGVVAVAVAVAVADGAGVRVAFRRRSLLS